MVNFDFDPEEIVEWNGVGRLTLRPAVRRVMALAPGERRLVALYRAPGKQPGFFGLIHVEQLATLPEFEGC